MGGGDKALRLLGGQTMLGRVIERLRPQVGSHRPQRQRRSGALCTLRIAGRRRYDPRFRGAVGGRPRGHALGARERARCPLDRQRRRRHAVLSDRPRRQISRPPRRANPTASCWPLPTTARIPSSACGPSRWPMISSARLTAGTRKILAWTDTHDTVLVKFEAFRLGGRIGRSVLQCQPPRGSGRGRDDPGADAVMTQPPLQPVIGIAGWKNSGKTTLAVRLIEELTRRGYRVSSLKHAHHDFQIDTAETDSARHRRAGAREVAIVSPDRWAVISELKGQPSRRWSEMLARLAPCDLVVVEGFKSAADPQDRGAAKRGRPDNATEPRRSPYHRHRRRSCCARMRPCRCLRWTTSPASPIWSCGGWGWRGAGIGIGMERRHVARNLTIFLPLVLHGARPIERIESAPQVTGHRTPPDLAPKARRSRQSRSAMIRDLLLRSSRTDRRSGLARGMDYRAHR